MEAGGAPKSGWAPLAPELHVERAEANFVDLEHLEGHPIMLCQRHDWWGNWVLRVSAWPGVMFRLYFSNLEPAMAALGARGWPIYHVTSCGRSGAERGIRRPASASSLCRNPTAI